MTARERILAIRLFEKQKQNSAYTKRIGIQIRMIPNNPISEAQHV